MSLIDAIKHKFQGTLMNCFLLESPVPPVLDNLLNTTFQKSLKKDPQLMIALEKIIEIHPELADDFRCKRFRELFNKLKELPNKSKETNNLFITTENSQKFSHSDFKPSVVWSVHYFSLLLEQLLNDRQREEWIGDLEEALYKMYEQKYPRWRLHFETLRRVFYLLKGLLIAKTNSFVYKRRTTK